MERLTVVTEVLPNLLQIYKVEPSGEYILEIKAFGYQYASRYVKLKSRKTADRIIKQEKQVIEEINKGGSGLGKIFNESNVKNINGELFFVE